MSESVSKKVGVIDILSADKTQTNYPSISALAKAIDAYPTHIANYLLKVAKSDKPHYYYRGRYMIIELNKSDTSFIPTFSVLKSEVEITNLETGIRTDYPTLSAGAKVLGITRTYLLNYLYLKNPKPILDKYCIKYIGSNKIEKSKDLIAKNAVAIEVHNVETKQIMKFPSISDAGRYLGTTSGRISTYLNGKPTKPLLGKYLIKREGLEVKLFESKAAIKVEVTNIETNETKIYPNIKKAALTLGIDASGVSKHLKGDKAAEPFRKKYLFKKL